MATFKVSRTALQRREGGGRQRPLLAAMNTGREAEGASKHEYEHPSLARLSLGVKQGAFMARCGAA